MALSRKFPKILVKLGIVFYAMTTKNKNASLSEFQEYRKNSQTFRDNLCFMRSSKFNSPGENS